MATIARGTRPSIGHTHAWMVLLLPPQLLPFLPVNGFEFSYQVNKGARMLLPAIMHGIVSSGDQRSRFCSPSSCFLRTESSTAAQILESSLDEETPGSCAQQDCSDSWRPFVMVGAKRG